MDIGLWRQQPQAATANEWRPEAFRIAVFVYCVKVGATRGVYYGAIYGVMLFFVGVILGAPFGLITGITVGALDALLLIGLRHWRQTQGARLPKFTALAQILMPPVTCAASDLMFHVLYGMQPMPIGFYEFPALLAGFASWEAARKMREWYIE